jgi:hypothetical protein
VFFRKLICCSAVFDLIHQDFYTALDMSVWLKLALMILSVVAAIAIIWVFFGPYIVNVWDQAL